MCGLTSFGVEYMGVDGWRDSYCWHECVGTLVFNDQLDVPKEPVQIWKRSCRFVGLLFGEGRSLVCFGESV